MKKKLAKQFRENTRQAKKVEKELNRDLTNYIKGEKQEKKGFGKYQEFKMPIGYCVKCKKKREMKGAVKVTMKGGRKAFKGTCPKCGTKMFRITA